SAQIREILINESAWEEMTCLFAPSLAIAFFLQDCWQGKQLAPSKTPHRYRTLFSGHFYLPSEMVPYATHRRNHENNNLL
ncbi:hypothetical protein ACP0HD_17475, partial [Escherichia coli]